MDGDPRSYGEGFHLPSLPPGDGIVTPDRTHASLENAKRTPTRNVPAPRGVPCRDTHLSDPNRCTLMQIATADAEGSGLFEIDDARSCPQLMFLACSLAGGFFALVMRDDAARRKPSLNSKRSAGTRKDRVPLNSYKFHKLVFLSLDARFLYAAALLAIQRLGGRRQFGIKFNVQGVNELGVDTINAEEWVW